MRKITSMTMVWSLIILILNSIVLYVVPEGRVSYWADWRFLGLILLSTVIDYVVGIALHKSSDPRRRKWLVTTSIVANLTLLGIFKYAGFFTQSLADLVALFGFELSAFTQDLWRESLAGFLLGFIEIFTAMVFPSTYRVLIAYSIILVILTFRPRGFFGMAHSTQLRL